MNVVNLFARNQLPYDTVKDFTGIARLAANPLPFSVHPSLPARTPKELVALARARPGELTYGTASPTGFQRRTLGSRLNFDQKISSRFVF